MTDERPSGGDRGPTNDADDTRDGSAIRDPVPAGEKAGSDGATRSRRSAFFRVGWRAVSPVSGYPVRRGARLNANEADRQIRAFLTQLAGERQLEFRADPVEMARENDLRLLFGPDEEEEFARLALTFPDETVKRWATLLSGGNRSEAFGPRSRAERRDEAAVARELQTAVLRRVLGGLLVLALLGVSFLGIRALIGRGSEGGPGPGLRFAQPTAGEPQSQGGNSVPGGPPIAEPALTAVADRIVAVLRGGGPIAERIRLSVPAAELPILVGSVSAAVFQYDQGQIALVGPEGWIERSCVRVSVTTELLRPLDVVRYVGLRAECPVGMVGRDPRVTCLGSSVLILAIEIPQQDRPKELPEGGMGWAEKVRFGVEAPSKVGDAWEVLAVRGTIEVPVGEEDVVIPRFGGAPGDELTVDLGEGADRARAGTCRLS